MALKALHLLAAGAAAALLAGCNSDGGRYPARAYAPIPPDTLALFASKSTTRNAPVLVRAYKKESEIEVWKQTADGQYVHVKTYPVCRWSGQLGPKKREGDRQVPEGFYTIASTQMNPNSAFWLSFNVGYPNAMERAMGRNGGDIMVHGTCSSRGCFAMTNEQIEEIYAVMREAFNGGQKTVQFQSYPFRMTAENLARFRHDPNIAFWKNLKEGNDHFEVTKQEPRVGYCGGKYVFNGTIESGRMDPLAPCPKIRVDEDIASAVAAKQHRDDVQVAELVQKGTPAVRVQYADGSQHASFRSGRFAMSSAADDRFAASTVSQSKLASLAEISRPEAVDDVREYHVDDRGQMKDATKSASPQSLPARPGTTEPSPVVPAAVAATATGRTLPAGSAASSAEGSVVLPGPPGAPSAPAVAPSRPASVTTTANSQPFFKRWFGAEESQIVPAAEPPLEQPAKVPLPPRRQAEAPNSVRQAALQVSGTVPGAAPIIGQGLVPVR